MKSRWRISPWSGAAIGVVAAAVLGWLLREGQQALRSAVMSIEPDESAAVLTGAFWLLFIIGAVLVAIVVAARLHPLIAAIPAVWFLVVFGPTLLGVLGTPDWYPDWLRSYFLQTAGEAGPLVTGVLVSGTVAAFVRLRRTSPDSATVETERARP